MTDSPQSFLDAVPSPQMLLGPDEKVLIVNEGARRLFGRAVVGRHYITALRHPAVLDCVEATIRRRKPAMALYPARDGTRDTTWQVSAGPVSLASGQGTLITFDDKTDLQEAGQIRRDFVANVSHELRTPLTALLGFIETLQGPAQADPEARSRFLRTMEHEAARMNRLVHELLSLSRVESEERVRPTQRVDLLATLASVVEAVRPLAIQQDVRIVLTGASELPALWGDGDQLCQVFTNLIENAIKYGRPGGEVVVTVSGSAREPSLRGPAVRVAVRDQGEGIAAIHIPRLTERFYRVDTHRSRELGGTGLGLAIVKHIVARHRGRLRIESELGVGSIFTVILPLPEVGQGDTEPAQGIA
ncbi:sensor histidine kinase [Roseitranquillus sediminis]|uniref:sensor histidine kinase n=1 Tax=Roseitranquillus sediminis TaxID=2809051 RepID=UPI001D0CB4B6|nr:ATP-binding protein [Roseitranquillus sediminis]MBM9595604.1 two-component sensor histidine kinase [Roseitranquillus sediminis]